MNVQLQYRHNNGYDSVVLVDTDSGLVRSGWMVDRSVMEEFCNCSFDASDWDDRGGDEHKPDDYGQLVAKREEYDLVACDPALWANRVEFFCH